MPREISLSGGEIAVIKALGVSGATVQGSAVISRLADLEEAELVDTLQGLMMQDYVESEIETLRTIEDVERSAFKVNPQHGKDLRGALSPGRNEREGRRQRRR